MLPLKGSGLVNRPRVLELYLACAKSNPVSASRSSKQFEAFSRSHSSRQFAHRANCLFFLSLIPYYDSQIGGGGRRELKSGAKQQKKQTIKPALGLVGLGLSIRHRGFLD